MSRRGGGRSSYLIYNAVSNACTDTHRPWYQNNRDFMQLQPTDEDALRQLP